MVHKPNISDATRMRIQHILLLSRTRGTDPVAAMDAAGFVRHEGSWRRDMITTIDRIIDMVRNVRLSGDAPTTALEMRDKIIEMLEEAKTDGTAKQ